MAVVLMKRIYLCALRQDRKHILEALQRRGAVELSKADKQTDVFTQANSEEKILELTAQTKKVATALKIAETYTTIKKSPLASLEGRTIISVEDYNNFYQQEKEAMALAEELIALDDGIYENEREINRLQAQKDELIPWLSSELPLSYKGTARTSSFLGSVDGEHERNVLLDKIAVIEPDFIGLDIQVISIAFGKTCFIVTTMKEEQAKLKRALDQLGFSLPSQTTSIVPREKSMELTTGIEERQVIIAEKKTQREAKSNHLEELQFLSDYLKIRLDKYRAINSLTETKHTFILEGYVVASQAEAIQQEIGGQYSCMVEVRELTNADDPPTALKNSWFSEPVESVVSDFGMPSYHEIDPTSVMSFFYYIMFGMIFSDAGYGLILVLVCGGLLLRFRKMEAGTSRFLRMFFWCGVTTVMAGVVFSSYFGDIVNVVAKHFFNSNFVLPPLWFSPLENPMKLLIFCMALGIIHLSTGYIMKAVANAKAKDYRGIIYDCVFPLGVLFGILPPFMASEIFGGMAGFTLSLPPIATPICFGFVAFCCVGIIFTGGRPSSSWGKRIAKGIYQLYSVLSGWLSDILSYSRLLALGLATGVIASVINMLGSMLGKGVVGTIGFVLVFLLGHAMNFGINILGTYVHSNRLEFVEFFGKFYEGAGRKFSPLTMNTKYYKFREDVNNG